jgi:hypothetical protein
MNYHLLEYSELKQEAKARRIKFYYVKRKAELIQLLSMKELPEQYIVEKLRISQLKEMAKAKNYPQVYAMSRQMLVELLYPHLYRKAGSQQQDKNHDGTQKHNAPKEHHAE